jgi:hypothetical protein
MTARNNGITQTRLYERLFPHVEQIIQTEIHHDQAAETLCLNRETQKLTECSSKDKYYNLTLHFFLAHPPDHPHYGGRAALLHRALATVFMMGALTPN